MMGERERLKRVLLIASGGGHWQQLMLMRPAFDGQDLFHLTTLAGLPEQYGASRFAIVPECNRNDKVGIMHAAVVIGWHVLRYRPHVVVSTGALPGVIALSWGRTIGARTIWIDSVANAEEMSMSGRLAKRVAHLWLSQWEHIAEEVGAAYAGSVL